MIRGSTPTHIFEIPFDTSNIADLRVIYSQNGREIVSKRPAECTLDGQVITVTLTQEDTLKFDCSQMVKIQLKILSTNGRALLSDVMLKDVDECLSDEVLAV